MLGQPNGQEQLSPTDHTSAVFVRNTHMAQSHRMSDTTPRWKAGPLTRAALTIAAEQFADKARKGIETPYLSHLLAVSALVMEHGGSEVQAAAGLLHDVIEDVKIPGSELECMLVQHGSPEVAAAAVVAIVESTTDGQHGEKRDEVSWPVRKRAYIRSLRDKPSDDASLLVSLADKVHNAESTVQDIRAGTTATELYAPDHFNAKAPLQKWYYTELAAVFRDHLGNDPKAGRLVRRLEAAVDEIFVGVDVEVPT